MNLWAKLAFAVRRPDLLLRKLRGQEIVVISLDEVVPYLPPCPVVVEAGALDGSDTERMAQCWPQGHIHAFEPVPEAYAKVVERVGSLANVSCYPVALSDGEGTARMHVSSARDGTYRPDSSSLLAPKGHLDDVPDVAFYEQVEVRVTTLDQWARATGVRQVDFLWLDMQGMELRALKSGTGVLRGATAVCAEVARSELYEGNALYGEMIDWMRTQGFAVAIDRVSVNFGNILFVRARPRASR